MLSVSGIPVLASTVDILHRIRRETGLLRDIHVNGDKALITCVSHADGRENKPSCLINLQATAEYKAGDWKCFACNEHGSIAKLVGIAYKQNELWGTKWLLQNYASGAENRNACFHVPSRIKKGAFNPTITEEELDQYRYIHPYMYERHLTDDIIEKYDIGYKDGYITFPIRDENGKLLFLAKRNVHKKEFILPPKLDKPLCYLYEAQTYFNTKYIYIVESLLNALTLAKWGQPAIALLGTGTARQIQHLKTLPYRKLILALDNDDAGHLGARKIIYALKDKLTERLLLKDKSKDINDYGGVTWEDFQNYLEK